MTQKTLVVGAVVASAVVLAGLVLRPLYPSALFDFIFLECMRKDENDEEEENSSLQQDLQDILEILPLEEIRVVIENHVRYNKQISDTVAFINDQKKFIYDELKRMPHVRLYVFILEELGLDLELIKTKVVKFWSTLPAFEGGKAEFKDTGLTGMINQIVSLIPEKEFHELLCQKSRDSYSFRSFLSALTFRQFEGLRKSVQSNSALQRHYFWAKECGTEATFAVELLGDLYAYLTQKVA